jgi:hypothetical protein
LGELGQGPLEGYLESGHSLTKEAALILEGIMSSLL